MSTPHADPFEMARAEVMLTAYDARWSEDMARYEVLAVEAEFFTALTNPETGAASRTWRLGGKLDVVVRDLLEQWNVVVEHKTASGDVGPGSDYLKRLRLDGQVSVYYAGGDALGFPISSCLYDVLVKPGLRPYRATPPEARKFKKDGSLYANQRDRDETPEEYRARMVEAVVADPNAYFQRAEVVRLEQEMRDALADVWNLGRSMRENEIAGRAPRNPDACVRYGRTCEFFGVCTGEESLDDAGRFCLGGAHAELTAGSASLLTSSRLSAYRACPRLHHLKYDLGFRPTREADTLRFGSLVHLGLEAWWKAPAGERLEAALAAIYPAAPASISAAATL
jgi:hypothetical protein